MHIPLLRIIALERFGDNEKATSEIQRLQKQSPELYKAAFGAGSNKVEGFLVELFPSEGRLCSHFAP